MKFRLAEVIVSAPGKRVAPHLEITQEDGIKFEIPSDNYEELAALEVVPLPNKDGNKIQYVVAAVFKQDDSGRQVYLNLRKNGLPIPEFLEDEYGSKNE